MHPLNLQIESWLIERLIPYARNPRTHSDEQVAQIAASIDEYGFVNPILVDPDGRIIAGHGRALAARKLGYTHVLVIVLGHLTPKQKRALRLADNKLALNASWDLEKLRLELEALAEERFNLQLTGFDEDELAELLAEPDQNGLIDADEAPEPQAQAVSQIGDLWALGDSHLVLCGDGTLRADLDRVLDGKPCDLVFTDITYNVDYTGKGPTKMKLINDNLGSDFGKFLVAACRSMLEVCHGPLYICMSSGELHRLYSAFTEGGGHWSTFIVWAKNAFTLGRSDYQRQFEPILYGWPEGRKHYWCGARDQGDVWHIDRRQVNDLHPTMKPVELIERAVGNSSRYGEVVLDPFAGSGTTAIACERLGRRARMVEIDPRFVDVIVKRWQAYCGKQACLVGDDRTFAEVALARQSKIVC